MCLYIKVTNDKYELPLAVADTPTELAAMTGDNINTIYTQVCRAKKGEKRYGFCRFLKIEID